MGKDNMFLNPVPPSKDDVEKSTYPREKQVSKIRTIGPDGTVTESDSIKESIEKVKSLDKQ